MLLASTVSFLRRLKDVSNTCQLLLLMAPFGVFSVKMIIFHTWHNFMAELTQFADREFYTVSISEGEA